MQFVGLICNNLMTMHKMKNLKKWYELYVKLNCERLVDVCFMDTTQMVTQFKPL